MRPLLLIQTGEAPESLLPRFGGFADWFRAAMRLEASRMHVVRVDEGGVLPVPHDVAGAVITGSAAMVTERTAWSDYTAAWIREAMDAALPLFGVCYGHQLMAHALGGEVGWLPAGREIGTQSITRNDPVVTDWPDGLLASFPAHTTHRQSVLAAPRGSKTLARSQRDPHQWLRYAPHTLSTQFHPEFTVDVMRAYIAARADVLREEGLVPDALGAGVRETESARRLLEHFAHAALQRQRAAAFVKSQATEFLAMDGGSQDRSDVSISESSIRVRVPSMRGDQG